MAQLNRWRNQRTKLSKVYGIMVRLSGVIENKKFDSKQDFQNKLAKKAF